MKIITLSVFLFSSIIFAQQEMEKNLDASYQNAKKGIYWALTNIPENKIRLKNDLIADEKLYATVKLEKQIDGIKIESKGYCNSTEVTIILYRSVESLIKDGYLKISDEKTEEKLKN